MKILMVNKFLHPNGGSETYVFKLGRYLEEIGHEVQYFGMEHNGRIVGNNINTYTSDMDFHGGSKVGKILYPVKTIYSIEARKKIRLVLNDFQPDVVHLNNFSYQLTPSIILEIVRWRNQRNRTCKIVFTAHDYNLICPNHMLYNPNTNEICEKCIGGQYRNCIKGKCIHGSIVKSIVGAAEGYYWKWRKTYNYIDKIICPSNFLKTKMDRNPLFEGRTTVLHNFVEYVEKKCVIKKDYVLYFGRYNQEKGILTLLAACKELDTIPFIFAGSGSLEDKISEIKNIKNMGFQTGEALEKLIREAKFSIYPSEWYENCPFSVMESMMFGTPVLGANIGGIPELIEENINGELFKPSDKNELIERIISLYNNKEKLELYNAKCYENNFFDIEKYTNQVMKVYTE